MAYAPWQTDQFRCRVCGHRYSLATEEETILARVTHESAHTLIEAMSPDLRAHVRGILTLDN